MCSLNRTRVCSQLTSCFLPVLNQRVNNHRVCFLQVNQNDRLWGDEGDEGDSTLPSPSLSDRGAEPGRPSLLLLLLLAVSWLLLADQ